MDSLDDVYEDRSRESGLEGLYTELRSRLFDVPTDRRGHGSELASNHPQIPTVLARWLWFSSPSFRHYAACGTSWTIAGAWNLLVGVFVFGP